MVQSRLNDSATKDQSSSSVCVDNGRRSVIKSGLALSIAAVTGTEFGELGAKHRSSDGRPGCVLAGHPEDKTLRRWRCRAGTPSRRSCDSGAHRSGSS